MILRHTAAAILVFSFSTPLLAETTPAPKVETAILAGGCFWCIEADYEKLEGVLDVVSGYTGGKVENPTYQQVSAGRTGHIEAVKVTYDANQISYAAILEYFWRHIDPTRDDGQFCDRGSQYRPAIFYATANQKTVAIDSKQKIEQTKPFSDPIKAELLPASTFYLAEEYHQDYYKKNPLRYHFYRYNCGRDARVEQLWGKQKETEK